MSSSSLENDGGHVQPEGRRYTSTTGAVKAKHPTKLTQPRVQNNSIFN
jgi:hypothetical protein